MRSNARLALLFTPLIALASASAQSLESLWYSRGYSVWVLGTEDPKVWDALRTAGVVPTRRPRQ